MKKYLGFTIIEVLVVITVSVVLMAVLAPSLIQIVQKARLSQAHQQIVGLLQKGKSVSIRSRRPVFFDSAAELVDSTNEWGGGIRVWKDDNDNGSFEEAELITYLPELDHVTVDATNDRTSFNFRPSGKISVAMEFRLCVDGLDRGSILRITSASSNVMFNDDEVCVVR